jgi:hypothetical protein
VDDGKEYRACAHRREERTQKTKRKELTVTIVSFDRNVQQEGASTARKGGRKGEGGGSPKKGVKLRAKADKKGRERPETTRPCPSLPIHAVLPLSPLLPSSPPSSFSPPPPTWPPSSQDPPPPRRKRPSSSSY